jgi:hypothetical protein
MSYISKRPSGVRVPKPMGGVLDFLDDLATGGLVGKITDVTTKACAQLADQQAQTADTNIKGVQDGWNPTGYYTPDQMSQVITYVLDMKAKASAAVGASEAAIQIPTHRDILDRATAFLTDSKTDPNQYVAAIQDARSQSIDVIDSTGFKTWVVNCLKATREAQWASTVVSCARPDIMLGAIAGISRAVDAVIGVLKTIGGAVIDAASTVLKIPDFLGDVMKYGKWALLIGAGFYVATKTGILPNDPLGIRK